MDDDVDIMVCLFIIQILPFQNWNGIGNGKEGNIFEGKKKEEKKRKLETARKTNFRDRQKKNRRREKEGEKHIGRTGWEGDGKGAGMAFPFLCLCCGRILLPSSHLLSCPSEKASWPACVSQRSWLILTLQAALFSYSMSC